ncbi:MAG: SH3 domain-containing protein [Phormidesmis sp.]
MKKHFSLIAALLVVAGCSQAVLETTGTAVEPEWGEPIEAVETIASDTDEENLVLPEPETVAVPDMAPGARLLPVDEGIDNESFNNFRARLIEAVENQDTAFLLEVVHPDIQNSFGRSNGIENFKQRWNIDAADSELWLELAAVLKLGGTFARAHSIEANTDVFVAPYVFTNFPSEYSAFEHAAIIGGGVILRAEPTVDSEMLATLSYHIVSVDRSQSIHDETHPNRVVWAKVATTEGKAGYVAGQYVRRPVDYRAFFENQAGKWTMTFFAAGD